MQVISERAEVAGRADAKVGRERILEACRSMGFGNRRKMPHELD
jgi:hypothetical protein